MAQTMVKRIPLSEERWRELGDIKQAGQTYDDLIGDMVKSYKRKELAQIARDARAGKGNWHKL